MDTPILRRWVGECLCACICVDIPPSESDKRLYVIFRLFPLLIERNGTAQQEIFRMKQNYDPRKILFSVVAIEQAIADQKSTYAHRPLIKLVAHEPRQKLSHRVQVYAPYEMKVLKGI